MRQGFIPFLALVSISAIAGCSSPHSSGYGPLRIETYPVDAPCRVNGDSFTMQANAPADIVVPISAAPLQISCETESGYKGTETLATVPDPWSPSNVGLGFLSKSAGSGQRLPEFVQVTLIYTEAGKPQDLGKPANEATGAEMSEEQVRKKAAETSGRSMASKDAKEMAAKDDMKDMTLESVKADAEKAAMAKDAKMLKKAELSAPRPAGGLPASSTAGGSPAPPAATPENKPVNLASSSTSRIHLSSFKERANADKSRQTLWLSHKDLLQGLSASIETVDLGRKGTFHRVYAGPLKTDRAARDLCNALKRKRVYCRPVSAGSK